MKNFDEIPQGLIFAHLETRPVGQAVKTPPFHGGITSSILVRVTRQTRHSAWFFYAPQAVGIRCRQQTIPLV